MASDVAVPQQEPAPTASRVRTTGRLLFVDSLRIFLTVLVIVHHLMVIYAGTGGWIWQEGRQDELTELLGGWFCAVNQSYFMGLFLLISAYFVPGSYDRKGPVRFLVDRLIRLGIPLAVYSWLVRPLFVYFVLRRREGMSFGGWYRTTYFDVYGLLGGGPLWFIEALLLFSMVYVVVRLLTSARPPRPASGAAFPGNGWIALFAFVVGLASFLVRLASPVNAEFRPLNFQFANFPQYIALFAAGLVAYRRNWLLSLPDRQGRLWLWTAVALVLLFAPLALVAGGGEEYAGGWYWQAMAFALWEAFMCVGMCTGLVYLFRRRWDGQGALARESSRAAYGAYLIHEPVITAAAILAMGVALYPLAKFAVATVVLVPVCFGLAALLRRVPYFDRVL